MVDTQHEQATSLEASPVKGITAIVEPVADASHCIQHQEDYIVYD